MRAQKEDRWVRRSWPLCLISLLLLILGCQDSKPRPPTAEEVLKRRAKDRSIAEVPTGERALTLWKSGEEDEAWEVSQQALVRDRSDGKAVYVAANILHRKGRTNEAIQLLDGVAQHDRISKLVTGGQAASWSLDIGQLRAAEHRFKALLKEFPEEASIHQQLSHIYEIQGRRWESSQHLRFLLHAGKENDHQRMMLVDLSEPIDAGGEIERLLRLHPSDPLPKLGWAFRHLHDGRIEEAESLFREVWDYGEAPTACWIGIGMTLALQQDLERLHTWLASAPEDVEQFPEYWLLLGQSRLLDGEDPRSLESSCRAFAESVMLDRSRSWSLHQLGQVLAQLQWSEAADVVLTRASHVEKLSRALQRIGFGNKDAEVWAEVGLELQWLGREEEANRWLQRAGRTSPNVASTSHSRLTEVLDRIRSQFPLPAHCAIEATKRRSVVQTPSDSTIIRFRERLELFDQPVFFEGGHDLDQPGMTIYQSNGGGVSVVDYDLDGWPDLYVVQGGNDPRDPSRCSGGKLLRNRAGIQCIDVAASAHAQNFAFGCSVGVGDWNQDGYPDLYIANYGINKLLENCGDGTFQSIALPYQQVGLHWTSCATVADLNGDGLPDLLEINYADAEAAYQKRCSEKNNVPRVCRPTEFDIERNRIWINQCDGTFAESVAEYPWQDGRGLGVVAANFDRKYGNDVYLANDWSANNFLMSHPDPNASGRFVLRDEAALRGCAVDNEGRPQAGMGIACGDVNRDGLLDLFVTNFYDEYNTLYLQRASGLFEIATRRYQLFEPSQNMLGFGTQFGDFNHDGWLDLAIVNGHVDDFRQEGMTFRMLPQILVHRGDRFELQDPTIAGSYFERPALGRGLAVWDFNRDGRLDLVATHLDQPLSVLQNESPFDSDRQGHWIELELVGTTSDRDAVGAYVECSSGHQRWTTSIVAGNGFACANERFIHLGLHDRIQLDQMTITWPDGSVEQYQGVSSNRRYLAVQHLGLHPR